MDARERATERVVGRVRETNTPQEVIATLLIEAARMSAALLVLSNSTGEKVEERVGYIGNIYNEATLQFYKNFTKKLDTTNPFEEFGNE